MTDEQMKKIVEAAIDWRQADAERHWLAYENPSQKRRNEVVQRSSRTRCHLKLMVDAGLKS